MLFSLWKRFLIWHTARQLGVHDSGGMGAEEVLDQHGKVIQTKTFIHHYCRTPIRLGFSVSNKRVRWCPTCICVIDDMFGHYGMAAYEIVALIKTERQEEPTTTGAAELTRIVLKRMTAGELGRR